jgi:rod shape-determining protein MreD
MRWLIPLLALAAVLQSVALPGLTANGIRPDLALVLVIGWASLRGWEEGAIAGTIGGFFLDVMSAAPFGVNMIRLAVLGIVAGLVMDRLHRTGAVLPVAALMGCCLLAYAFTVMGMQAAGLTVSLERSFFLTAVPSAALTLGCMAALFPVFRALDRRFNGDDLSLGRDG